MKNIPSEMFKAALRSVAQLMNEKARLLSGKEPEGLGSSDLNELDIALETLMDARNGYAIEFDFEDTGEIKWKPKEESFSEIPDVALAQLEQEAKAKGARIQLPTRLKHITLRDFARKVDREGDFAFGRCLREGNTRAWLEQTLREYGVEVAA